MGLMTSQLQIFKARSVFGGAFVVPKLILLFTKAGRSAQPYSINFDSNQKWLNGKSLQYCHCAMHLSPLFLESY